MLGTEFLEKFRALLQDSGPKHSIDLNCTPGWLQASFIPVVVLNFSLFWLCGAFVGAWVSRCRGLSSWGARALGPWTLELRLTGSRAQAQQLWCPRRLSCSVARGIFLDQGLNPSPALAGRFSTTEPPGSLAGQLWIRQLTWSVPPTFFSIFFPSNSFPPSLWNMSVLTKPTFWKSNIFVWAAVTKCKQTNKHPSL